VTGPQIIPYPAAEHLKSLIKIDWGRV
jgi:hypothetical protein